MEPREVKDTLYEQFARVAKAASHPRRLEILDLLRQGERSVEAISIETGLGVTTTSAQLQLLRHARLVSTRREGTRVFYRLADDTVSTFLVAVQQLARARLTEIDQIVRTYFASSDSLNPISRDELRRRLDVGDVVLLDVRPQAEFASGHIPGAVSIPLDEIAARLAELPSGIEIVAYCRGPYCVLAPQSIEILKRLGRRARRLEDGFPEWQLAGLPVALGASA
ncbi:MAG: metalloregulator ArsR/SmtB family transcription factor [Chloroflexi bacterium]|nr:metalloregulator ArsR/SmtB family transcription factor [Chloroflexota bacterium]